MLKQITIPVLILLFIGCNSSSNDDKSNNDKIIDETIKGKLVDGYIKNATLCLDKNLNGFCDIHEKTSSTNDNGEFVFTNVVKSNELTAIIGFGGIDTATNQAFEGQMKAILKLNTKEDTIISPITDIVASSFLNSSKKLDLYTLNEIKEKIAENLNIDKKNLSQDPMQDKVLFAKAQEIVALNSIVKELLFNNDDTKISKVVSKAFLDTSKDEDISISNILMKSMQTNFNQNIAEYASNQYLLLKQGIKDNLLNKSINISNLNRYQTSIHSFTSIFKENIKNKNYSNISNTFTAKSNNTQVNTSLKIFRSGDFDNDFIPDDVEDYLGMDKTNNDENNNNVIDGLESTTSSISDQFFNKQWHIRSLGTQVNPFPKSVTIMGNDLNLMPVYKNYMGYNKGDPIVVQVVDTGVEAHHEDLVDNMDLSLSRDSGTKTMGDPVESALHGTICAGIIGARAFNGKGLRGVAPFVKIAGSNWLKRENQNYSELEEVWTKNDPDGKIAISSNSWGGRLASLTEGTVGLMEYASKNLRKVNGKVYGKIFVKSSGNYRNDRHDTDLSYVSSNPYVITVAGITNKNIYAPYSSPGSNILVSAYAGDQHYNSATIAATKPTGDTTLPTWDEDEGNKYTYAMNGTSAAAPMVAGALALVLEACPTLPWRDVKYLIAKTAIKVDPTNATWKTNSAGLHHSIDYGFGLINTQEIISECQNNYQILPTYSNSSQTFYIGDVAIADNDIRGRTIAFNVNDTKSIEWIGVKIYSDHSRASDLEIYLTSPTGTTSRIMWGDNSGGPDYSLLKGFKYGSVAFMGEKSNGKWKLRISDIKEGEVGKITKLEFEVFGH